MMQRIERARDGHPELATLGVHVAVLLGLLVLELRHGRARALGPHRL